MQCHEIVEQGLDRALALHVGKLFDVLITDPSPAGHRRFMAGIDKSTKAYETAKVEIASALQEQSRPGGPAPV